MAIRRLVVTLFYGVVVMNLFHFRDDWLHPETFSQCSGWGFGQYFFGEMSRTTFNVSFPNLTTVELPHLTTVSFRRKESESARDRIRELIDWIEERDRPWNAALSFQVVPPQKYSTRIEISLTASFEDSVDAVAFRLAFG